MAHQSDQSPDLSIYSFFYRLDPNAQQVELFTEMTLSARWAYNRFVELWHNCDERRHQRAHVLMESGMDRKAAYQQVKAEAKTDPLLRWPTSTNVQREVLTPEIKRHREAARLLWKQSHGQHLSPEEAQLLDALWGHESEDTAPFLHRVTRRCLVSGVDNAQRAANNFFDSHTGQRQGEPMGKPAFKKTRSNLSVTIPRGKDPLAVKGGKTGRGDPPIEDYAHIYLPGLDLIGDHPKHRTRMRRVRVQKSTKPLARLLNRYPESARVTSYTLSHRGGYWYVSLTVHAPAPTPQLTRRQRDHGIVGADVGIRNYIALSDGSPVIDLPRSFKRAIRRLSNLRRKLARAQPKSHRRKKVIKQIQRAEHRLMLQRRGFIHEITAELTRHYRLIGIEDLNIKGMTTSAKGTKDNPGKNVKAKSATTRGMLSGTLGELRRQLEYKSKREGSTLIAINRWYPSSKTCSRCGWVNKKLTRSQRVFRCLECGLVLDRDRNAAINIAAVAEKDYQRLVEADADNVESPHPSSQPHDQ